MAFYDQLAVLYDKMIDFDLHLENDIDIYRKLLAKYHAEQILDAGCGTGLHSLIFARLGRTVTGIDNSEAMIRRARDNAARHRLEVRFLLSDFKNFNAYAPGPFDAIYCLGNSFVHLRNETERQQVLANFYRVLTPGGMLCLQLLNYDRILKDKPKIISEKKHHPYHFIRTYTYRRNKIIFKLEISGLPEKLTLQQNIFPIRTAELRAGAATAGFRRIEFAGSMSLAPFDPDQSQNTVALAWRDQQ